MLTLADAGVFLKPCDGGHHGDGWRQRAVTDEHAGCTQHQNEQQPLQKEAALHGSLDLHANLPSHIELSQTYLSAFTEVMSTLHNPAKHLLSVHTATGKVSELGRSSRKRQITLT